MSEFKWYSLVVSSGSEMKVYSEIEKIKGKDENIKEIFFPTQKILKTLKGEKKEVEAKFIPNYIFIKMKINKNTLDSLRILPKVIGFIGKNPMTPTAISDIEIENMKSDNEKRKDEVLVFDTKYKIGDTVKIKQGHFESFNGIIESIDEEKNILKLSVSIFGRNTIIEIRVSDVEKI